MTQGDGSTQDAPLSATQASATVTVSTDTPPQPPVVGQYVPPTPAAVAASAVLRASGAAEINDAGDGPSQTSTVTPDSLVGPVMMWALTIFFAFVVIVATDVLLSVWPAAGAADGPQVGVPMFWGLITLQVSVNDRLMLISIVMGVIGSMIHVLTSFADFVGNRRLAKSWVPWYMVRPVIGSGLALFFYVIFRGGLLTGNDTSNVNPFGIAALGGLAGMFSKQATDKLSEVFSTMFNVSADGGDAQRGGKLDSTASTRPTGAVVADSDH